MDWAEQTFVQFRGPVFVESFQRDFALRELLDQRRLEVKHSSVPS